MELWNTEVCVFVNIIGIDLDTLLHMELYFIIEIIIPMFIYVINLIVI